MSHMKNPGRYVRHEFRIRGGEVARRDSSGAWWEFPDGWRVFVRRDLPSGKAAQHVAEVANRYRVGVESTSGAAHSRPPRPVFKLEQIRPTRHASERLVLMRNQAGITWPELVATLTTPKRVAFSASHESWLWVGDRLAVALVEEAGGVVIKTVLWSRQELFDAFPRPEKQVERRVHRESHTRG